MKQFRQALVHFTEIIEVLLAVAVAVIVVMDMIGMIPRIVEFWNVKGSAEDFANILSSVLGIIVGTEFINMLLKPSLSNVTEVLIFLIARHIIVAEATPIDNLISVISIAILFILEFIMARHRRKSGDMLLQDPRTLLKNVDSDLEPEEAESNNKCDSQQ